MFDKIVGVAIKAKNGVIHYLPSPKRHHHIFNQSELGPEYWLDSIQGFLTSEGKFVGRKRGFLIANFAKQIIHKTGNINKPILYSEDMW